MLLVVGATGMLGSEVCRQLVANGVGVRALVRPTSDATRVQELREMGVVTVEGDLRDTASLVVACTGIEGVVSTATAILPRLAADTLDAVDRDGQLALVAAAEAAGVRHFTYVSCSGRVDLDCAFVRAKRTVEERLRASRRLTHTILRPTAFMEVWLTPALGFDIARSQARIPCSGRERVSWVSMVDVARFAVAATTHAFVRNATIDIGGPQALSLLEVVQACEEQGCPPFELEFVDVDTLERRWRAATTEPARSLAALTLAVSRGDSVAMHRMLAFFPFQLATVRQHVARALRRLPDARVASDYRYVSKKPEPMPRTDTFPIRPESVARPFI